MATGVPQYKVSLSKWKAALDGKLDALARQSSLQVAENVVRDTPVDTGFLRGSWQPSIGEPKGGGVGAVDVAMVIAGMKAGDRFFMINNAAYAMRLENGFVGEDSLGRYYDQKGRFFVRDNIKRWPGVVRAVVKDLTGK